MKRESIIALVFWIIKASINWFMVKLELCY